MVRLASTTRSIATSLGCRSPPHFEGAVPEAPIGGESTSAPKVVCGFRCLQLAHAETCAGASPAHPFKQKNRGAL